MFTQLEAINTRPTPFEFYTAADLWTDEHTSAQMLAYHLNSEIDVSSRNGAFIDRSVAWITDHFGVTPGFRIADFGCGPGLYANRLAACDAAVTGIDFSPRSIAYARETAQKAGLDVAYVQANYLEFSADEPYDLVMMIMCDFCALSPEQRRQLLGIFKSVLKPGGRLLFDVYSKHAYAKREESAIYEKNLLNGFWSPNAYYGFLNTCKYDKEMVVLDKYTLVETDRTRTVYNWLQYFTPDALRQELAESGFHIERFYGDVAGAPFDPDGDEFAIEAGI